jgi:hypothetical protein
MLIVQGAGLDDSRIVQNTDECRVDSRVEWLDMSTKCADCRRADAEAVRRPYESRERAERVRSRRRG